MKCTRQRCQPAPPSTAAIQEIEGQCVGRLIPPSPFSPLTAWRNTFQQTFTELEPRVVVPGHGSPCDPDKARAETGAYLDFLVTEVGAAVEAWEPLDEVVERLRSVARFEHLEHFNEWHPINVNRAYLELESA